MLCRQHQLPVHLQVSVDVLLMAACIQSAMAQAVPQLLQKQG